MSIRFVDLHYKGIRIQQGWRHLKTDVYFVILFVMTMVSLLCASAMPVFEQAMSGRDWEHLAGILLKVLLAGLALSFLSLLVVPFWNLLHDLQSLCDVIYTYPLYLVRNYIGEGELNNGKGSSVRREILYFPRIYYKNRGGTVEVTVRLDGSKFHDSGDFESLTKVLEDSLVLNVVDITQRREFLTYHLFRDAEKHRIRISDVRPKGYALPLMKGVRWDITKVSHALIVGGTGSGKSWFLHCLLYGFLRMGAEVHVCDPKNSGLADYEGVAFEVQTEAEGIMGCVAGCVERMGERYRQIKEYPEYRSGQDFSIYGLSPVILVIDEYTAFVGSLVKKEKDLFKDLIAQIVLKGRESGVFVVLATQRPDAVDLDGKIRDQLGLRVALGKMSDDGYRMIFGTMEQKLKKMGKPGQGYIFMDGMSFVQRFCAPFVPPGYDFISEAGKIKNERSESFAEICGTDENKGIHDVVSGEEIQDSEREKRKE